MKTISVREMKAQWAEVERQVKRGVTFEVLNRGKPAVRIVPAQSRKIVAWPDFLGRAAKGKGKKGSDVVIADREGRW
jgi:antitoxin (DNA-binding transcriptional repressor) of toxin-antitoxin stability system